MMTNLADTTGNLRTPHSRGRCALARPSLLLSLAFSILASSAGPARAAVVNVHILTGQSNALGTTFNET